MQEAINLTNFLASGDLNAQLSTMYSDELSGLFQAYNKMSINLNATILEV
ncbi:hypothetical protein [Nitrosomonas aestuarii]